MGKILVTGAGGNVGQYIAGGLAHAGYEVVGVYRNRKPEKAGYELACIDLSEGLPRLKNIDAVIHIAAGLSGTAKRLVNDNIKATGNLTRLAEQGHIKRFIYMSTVSVYGDVRGELCESSDIINPGCYGMTKYISECLVKESAIPEKLIIQLPRMLGPFVDLENTEGSGFLTMAKKIIQGRDVVCFIPEVKYNNYLHVSELGKFIELVLKKERWTDAQTVLLGAGERLEMREILQIMKEEIGSRSEIIPRSNGVAPKCSLIDISMAKTAGFSPCHANEMLRSFIREVYIGCRS